MTPQDEAYLRAELARAQQLNIPTTMIRVAELQSLLDQLRRLSLQPVQPVKIFGFAREGEVDQMYRGKVMTIRVRRVANDWCTEPVYADLRA